MSDRQIKVVNPEGDFYMVQNHVIQLAAENKITKSSFLLYSFYKSLGGFDQILCSYDYISKNTGLSKGSITNGNKELVKNGLIILVDNGPNRAYEIRLIPGNELPRRELKKIDRSVDERVIQQMNAEDHLRSENDTDIDKNNKYSVNKNNTTADQDEVDEIVDFIDTFSSYWCKMNKTDKYRKRDLKLAYEIDNIPLAKKLIPVLWCIEDKWVQKSDKSMTVFVKEYMSGKLQSTYPNTKYYYIEKQKE